MKSPLIHFLKKHIKKTKKYINQNKRFKSLITLINIINHIFKCKQLLAKMRSFKEKGKSIPKKYLQYHHTMIKKSSFLPTQSLNEIDKCTNSSLFFKIICQFIELTLSELIF